MCTAERLGVWPRHRSGTPPVAACDAGGMPESVTWRVATGITLAKFGAALALAVFAASSGTERERLFLAGVAAVAFGVYGLRDVLAPVRLSADTGGVTVVSGFAGHRRVPWTGVERVGLARHRVFGLGVELLEIDTGESLHLFGRYDLGAPCDEVAETLESMRRAAAGEGGGGEPRQRADHDDQ